MNIDESSTPDGDGLDLDASVAKSLFVGRITEENLFPYPRIDADEAETLRMVSAGSSSSTLRKAMNLTSERDPI